MSKPSMEPWGRGPSSPAWWPALGLVLLIGVNAALDPGFLSLRIVDGHLYGTPVDIVNQGSRIMLLALGMTLVIATGGVDLSVGSVVAISGAVCAQLLSAGAPLPVVMTAAVGAGMLVGLANGILIARFGVQPIVATLIMMVAGRGVAQLITDGQVLPIRSRAFEFLANGFVLTLPFAAVMVAGLYLATHLFLRRTAAGLFIEAVGDNATAGRFVGLPALRIKAGVYVFSGACAGLCGVLAASHIQAADSYRAGEMMELDAIFAVVIGGTALTGGRFYLAGALVGALLLQTLTLSMYYLGIPPAVAPVPKAILIVAVALLHAERVRTRLQRWRRRLPRWKDGRE